MDMKIELVAIPVTDVDHAKAFYVDQVGLNADHDQQVSPELRFVQLTPPGSACSIYIGTGLTEMAPGSQKGLQVVVEDVAAVREQLMSKGVETGEVDVQSWARSSTSATLTATPGPSSNSRPGSSPSHGISATRASSNPCSFSSGPWIPVRSLVLMRRAK